MVLFIAILTLTTFIYLTRDKTMFKQGYIYKVSFIDTKSKDHNVETLQVSASFGKTLEGLQEKGDIKCLAVLGQSLVGEDLTTYADTLSSL